MLSFKMTKDFSLLKKLHKKAFPGEYVRDFRSGDVCWLIYLDNKIVGFCSLRQYESDSVFLSRSASFKPGIGIHKKSIRHRLNWCKRHKIKWAITYVHIDNFKSLVGLVKSGFEIYEPSWDYAGKEFLYFRKRVI